MLRKKVEMRRFRLKRQEDETGISGTGYIAEGVQFSDGQCVINWLTATSSMGIYHSVVEMLHIHGHGGKTVIEWIDDDTGAGDPATESDGPLEEKLSSMEKKVISSALQESKGNKRLAASKLGLSRQGLKNKMRKYEIEDQANKQDDKDSSNET